VVIIYLDEPPIQQIVNAQLLPRIIKFLQREDDPQLRVEAVCVLTAIFGGTYAQGQEVIRNGAIFWFAKFLRSKNEELRFHSVRALGQIAGDSTAYRDEILANGALEPLLKIVEGFRATPNIIKEGIIAISNLCRGKPLVPVEMVKAAIPTLCKTIHSQPDSDFLIDAIWALSYASRTEETAQMVLDFPNTLSALISLMTSPFVSILIPSLRILGNICSGNDAQTDAVIDHPGFLEKVYNLFQHPKKTVRRENVCLISNIVTGTESQRNKLFKSFSFMEKLISCFKNEPYDVQREILHVFCTTLGHECVNEFLAFLDAGLLNCYLSILRDENSESSALRLVLEGIYYMLKTGRKMVTENRSEDNIVLKELEKVEIFDQFDMLQDHNDKGVCKAVTKILEEFMPFIEIKQKQKESEVDDDGEEDSDD